MKPVPTIFSDPRVAIALGRRLAASGALQPRVRRAPLAPAIRVLPRVIARAASVLALFALPACQSTGGKDGIKPSGFRNDPAWTVYLRGTPTFYDFDAFVKVLGPKAKVTGKVIDLQGGRIDGSKLRKPRSRDDEDSVALRLRIPGITLRNGIIDRIPGGIVCGADDCTFERLTFVRIGEDAWSNNTDKARNNRVIDCIFINDAGGDKSAQWNDGRDGLALRNYITGGITGIRIQESTGKARNVRFRSEGNTFVNVPTAHNVDGDTTVTASRNTYRYVEKRWVIRPRAKVNER